MAKYCRICLECITDGDYKSTEDCNLPQLRKLYLPELITEVSESVVCLRCFAVLQLFNTLRGKAVRTETKVQNYASANPASKIFTMAEVAGKKEAETSQNVVVKPDNSDEIIVTIDDSSADEDEEMMTVEEDMIIKEDNDLGVEIKSEDD